MEVCYNMIFMISRKEKEAILQFQESWINFGDVPTRFARMEFDLYQFFGTYSRNFDK